MTGSGLNTKELTLDRRDFLKSTGTAVALSVLPAAHAVAATPELPASGRTILPLNRNWRYKAAKVAGAEQPGFDDAGFEPVVIPHTNIALPWHNFDDRAYEFVSTYRRPFELPKEAEGRRVFIDFEGAMTASTVFVNGRKLGEYRGGYTPFSFEITKEVKAGENLLAVSLDSSERADIPPFGYEIDYMTFGGIYREVSLRIVPRTFIDNIFAHPKDVLTGKPALEVDVFLGGLEESKGALKVEVALLDGERVVARADKSVVRPPAGLKKSGAGADVFIPETTAPVQTTDEIRADVSRQTISLMNLSGIELWNLDEPKLYTVRVKLLHEGKELDADERRTGFRQAEFTEHGFELNGKAIKLRGLDRHQTFPFVGQAMPARVQRKDADILRHSLRCNLVRTSHYPQSRHFLDRCDEIGMLVLEEIPGWQHIGDEPWKQVAIDNVGRMIRRDWNHPSIILWGVRINESQDDHAFYTRTNALAHALDPMRQTGGIRNFKESELLEDVFTINDFGFPLRKPNHPRYLNTEFMGHTFPTKTIDNNERLREHTLRYARIYDQLASDAQYAGGIGWCAFDYNTHRNFGSGDRICYHGVSDIFREPKPAAQFYRSQCEPEEEVVLEAAFHWASGDESVHLAEMLFCSNCEELRLFFKPMPGKGLDESWKALGSYKANRKDFPHLKYPPFCVKPEEQMLDDWGDLRVEGYIKGKLVATKTLSGSGVNARFELLADDVALRADGADSTRVVLRVTDEFGNIRPFADEAVSFTLEGPASLIGDNPFSLVGGTGAVWIRAQEKAGTVRLTARHPQLGLQSIDFTLEPAEKERL